MSADGEEDAVNKALLAGKGKGRIVYFTAERLLLRMMEDRELSGINVVIFEDALKRSADLDILLGLLKPLLGRSNRFHIIFEIPIDDGVFIAKLRMFFGEGKIGVLSIPVNILPVTTMYTKQPIADYLQEARNTVLRIHAKESSEGDILVFVANNLEAKRLRRALESPDYRDETLQVLALSENDSNRLMEELSRASTTNQRTVYIATNRSENNQLFATLDVKYVVDTGFQGINVRLPITKASATVRSQMAGFSMLNPSVVSKCFRLYTAAAASSLLAEADQPEPDDGKDSGLAKSILRLKIFGIQNVTRDFPFFTVPSSSAFAKALSELRYLKLIDQSCEITQLGEFVGKIASLHLRWGVFMGVCTGKGSSEDLHGMPNAGLSPHHESKLAVAATSICGMISAGGLNAALPDYSFGRRSEITALHARFLALEGDLITMLNVFNAVNREKSSTARNYCKENGISFRVIETAKSFMKTYQNICIESRTPASGGPRQGRVKRHSQSGMMPSDTDTDLVRALLKSAAISWYDQIGKVESDGSLTVITKDGGYRTVTADTGSAYYELGPGELRRMQSPWFVYASMDDGQHDGLPEVAIISMAEPSVLIASEFWKKLGPD